MYSITLLNSLTGARDHLQFKTNGTSSSYAPGEMAMQPHCWSSIGPNWELNYQQGSSLSQWNDYDCSPPMSHMPNSPIDHPPVSVPAYPTSFNTSTSLQVPFDFKTNTVTSPQCLAMSPQQSTAFSRGLSTTVIGH